jgi:acyl-CoA reductase-like NAD-dependent aldehyde dehydrogenase
MPTTVAPADINLVLERLVSRKDAWVRVGIPDRIRYLRRALDRTVEEMDAWAAAGAAAQGLGPDSAVADEIRLTGPVVLARGLRLYLSALSQGGSPPLRTSARAGGRSTVRVMPFDVWDRLLFPFTSCEIWVPPGLPPTTGATYRGQGAAGPGRVRLVLGAGNISSISPADALHQLLVDNEVVLVKLHHITRWMKPILDRIFEDLVADGFVAFLEDAPGHGSSLVSDPRVDGLHMTGAAPTYDAIVWGTDPAERESRKRAGTPIVAKPFTAELGCVTPVIVVPGDWSPGDIAYQARSVAGMLQLNAGFNCNAAKVVVLAGGWKHKAAFLEALRRVFATLPERPAYYPGARDRWRAFVETYPRAERFGRDVEGVVPWTLVPGVPARKGEYALTHEAFCGVLAVTELEGDSAEAFLPRAVEFVNESVDGTLSAVVIADGATQRRHRDAFERALADLRYGCIGVNFWTGLAFGLMSPPWGAYPGGTPANVGSGIGFVHNGLLVDHVEKGIVRAPFRPPLKPLWFPDVKTARGVGRTLTRFLQKPSVARLPALVWEAVRA